MGYRPNCSTASFQENSVGGDRQLIGEESHRFRERVDGDDFDVLDDRGFVRIGDGNQQPPPALFLRRDRHRQGPFDRPDRTVQGQLAHDGVVAEFLGFQLRAGREDPERDRQVEGRGVLGKVGGRKIDDDAVDRAGVAAVDQGPFDAERAFAHGGFGEADQDRFGHRGGGNIDFDIDRLGINPEQRIRQQLGKHAQNAPSQAPKQNRWSIPLCGRLRLAASV